MNIGTSGYCMICGEAGGHGNLPCPRLQGGSPRAPEYYPMPPALAQSRDYADRLDRIIELLERIVDNTNPPR